MSEIKKIGIFTGGGDCGGLEAVIRGVVFAAHQHKIEVVGITNGYLGLYNLDITPPVKLWKELVDNRPKKCGTLLGTSRVKLSKIPDGFEKVAANLKQHEIDVLIGVGGDDTSSVLVELADAGFKVIWLPKTMDLDTLPYSVGGSSAINKIADFVFDLRTTARSHNRIMIIEVFGRYVGHTAFRGGVAGQADAILIPEIPPDMDILYNHMIHKYMNWIKHSPTRKGMYMIVVSEGIVDPKTSEPFSNSGYRDKFGHVELGGAGDYVRRALTERLKDDEELQAFLKSMGLFIQDQYEIPEVKVVNPGHLVRCGVAEAYDAIFGQKIGVGGVALALNGDFGYGVIDVKGKIIEKMPIRDMRMKKVVDLDEVALFEEMGYHFGRDPKPYSPETMLVGKRHVYRHL